MNQTKILNITPDRTRNNSSAIVKMVKDLETQLSPNTKIKGTGLHLKDFMI